MPVVVLAVDVNDRRGRKLFGCNVFQAPQVNPINSTSARCVTNAKRAHAAVFAEIVFVALGVNKYLVSSDSPERRRNASGFTTTGQNRFLEQIEQLHLYVAALGSMSAQSAPRRNDNYLYMSSAFFGPRPDSL
jgi:hypothetical protein